MPDIVEFLTARLDEDERRYKRLVYGDTHWKMLRTSAHLGSWNYSRQNGIGIGVATNDALMDAGLERMRKTLDGWQRDHAKQWLAEVKAKRERLALYVEVTDILFHGSRSGDRVKYQRESGRFEALDVEVRRDAALYDQHPDYKQEWRIDA